MKNANATEFNAMENMKYKMFLASESYSSSIYVIEEMEECEDEADDVAEIEIVLSDSSLEGIARAA